MAHKVKFYLKNYHCGNCETGVVQIHQQMNKRKEVTTTVSGCLDCDHEYGIRQALQLKEYSREDLTWP